MHIATLCLGLSMSNNEAFTLRLKPALLQFVREIAEEQNRSVPNYIETVLLAEKKLYEVQLTQQARESGPEQA
jgi:hypothetical protein